VAGLPRAEASPATRSAVLSAVYAKYFEATVAAVLPPAFGPRLAALEQAIPPPKGSTLMVHDLLNKFAIEDVLAILDEVGATDVEYVFLPLSSWDTKRKEQRERRKTRNKAYCFIHFASNEAATAFADALARYEFPDRDEDRAARLTRTKRMSATLAANQGIVPNILRLVDLPNRKWHPRAGSLCIRVNGRLEDVGVQALRDMLLDQLGRGSQDHWPAWTPAPGAQAQRQYPRPPRSDWTHGADPARYRPATGMMPMQGMQPAAWMSGAYYGVPYVYT
jgi:hypothetical protein